MLIDPKFISPDMTTDVELATKLDKSIIEAFFADTKEPTGFVNRTDSTLSFNDTTRTLSIAPVSSSFAVWIQGTKITISSTLTKQIPNTSGTYFFFINSSGVLDYAIAFDTTLLSDVAYTAFVLWNAVTGKAICFGEERHGMQMPSSVHSLLHLTRGTQLLSGGSISYLDDQDGTSDTHAEISLSDMSVMDEDIRVFITNKVSPSLPHEQILSPIAKIPLFYRDGTIWNKSTATNFPLLYGSNRAKYSKNTLGNWTLEEVATNNHCVVTYLFATTNISEPVIGLIGQGEYVSIDDAYINAAWSAINFGDLPAQEMKLLYILIFETSSTYSNTPKSRLRIVRDFRYGVDREVSATSSNSDHSNLSGLLGDDHPQYLTQGRGDARYYTQTQIDASLSGKQDTGNYITDLTGDVTASGPGAAVATLANSGVSAGTYNIVTVNEKGLVTSGSTGATTRYTYKTTANNSVTSATYADVAELTTASLPVGIYKFSFYGLAQSASLTSGIGFRIEPVTASVSMISGKFFFKQGADGVQANFQYDQTTTATNVTSASVQTANSDFAVSGEGVFVVSSPGTLAIQQRSELGATATTLRINSILIIEVV